MTINADKFRLPFIGIDKHDKPVIVVRSDFAIQLPAKWDGYNWTKLNDTFVTYELNTCSFNILPRPFYISNNMFRDIKIGKVVRETVTFEKCILFISSTKTIALSLGDGNSSTYENQMFIFDSTCSFSETDEVWGLSWK